MMSLQFVSMEVSLLLHIRIQYLPMVTLANTSILILPVVVVTYSHTQQLAKSPALSPPQALTLCLPIANLHVLRRHYWFPLMVLRLPTSTSRPMVPGH